MSTDATPLEATIVICSRNRPQMLAETVDSVLEGERVPRELLIVDQSTTAHADLARRGVVRGCTVTYVHSDSSGLSRARNIGIRASACDVVVLLDDDMYVVPDRLERLLVAHARAGARAVATGRVLAGPPEGASGSVPPAALVTREEPAVYRGRQPTDVVPGANVALYRDVVLALGGYDEHLGADGRLASADDNDRGQALYLASMLAGAAEVVHARPASSAQRVAGAAHDLSTARADAPEPVLNRRPRLPEPDVGPVPAGPDGPYHGRMRSPSITPSPSASWAVPTAVAVTGAACAMMIALDLDSPLRAVVALLFLALGPGLAITGLLQIRDPVQQVALAVAASFAIDTIVAVTLLYLEAYSVGLAFAIVAAFTAVALVLGALRRRTAPRSDPPREARPSDDDRADHAELRERLARYAGTPSGHADA